MAADVGTTVDRPPASVVTDSSLRTFGSVLRAALSSILHTDRVEGAANDVIADAGKILHATAADEHHRVLLEVMAHTRDVRDDFGGVREPHLRHLAERGVRLLRRRRVDARAHAT